LGSPALEYNVAMLASSQHAFTVSPAAASPQFLRGPESHCVCLPWPLRLPPLSDSRKSRESRESGAGAIRTFHHGNLP